MFCWPSKKVKFLYLSTFLPSHTCISPVSCKFRDFKDAVDGVHAIDEPRDRHGRFPLGPHDFAGPASRDRADKDHDEEDEGGELWSLHFNGHFVLFLPLRFFEKRYHQNKNNYLDSTILPWIIAENSWNIVDDHCEWSHCLFARRELSNVWSQKTGT